MRYLQSTALLGKKVLLHARELSKFERGVISLSSYFLMSTGALLGLFLIGALYFPVETSSREILTIEFSALFCVGIGLYTGAWLGGGRLRLLLLVHQTATLFASEHVMNLIPSDPRTQVTNPKVATAIMWLSGLALAGWVVPSLFQGLVVAAGGLIAGAVSIGFLLLVPKFAPWVALKTSNLATKLLLLEARTNPVETRQYIRAELVQEIDGMEADYIKSDAAVTTYAEKVRDLVRRFPDDAERFTTSLAVMQEDVGLKLAAVHELRDALAAFDGATERVSAIWEVTQAQRKAEALSASAAGNKARRQILEDATVKAADNALNEAMSKAKLARAKRIIADPNKVVVKHMGPVEVVNAAPAALPHRVDEDTFRALHQPIRQPESVRVTREN
jgi:hypothetical protein